MHDARNVLVCIKMSNLSNKYKYTVFALFGCGLIMLALFFIVGSPKAKYTIAFNTDGGSSITDQIVVEGEKIIKPTDPTKENSTFVRWEYQNKEYNFNEKVTSDMTLKAIWEDDDDTPKYRPNDVKGFIKYCPHKLIKVAGIIKIPKTV